MSRMIDVALTEVEIVTLTHLVENEIDCGEYYGNREQYYRRLARIKKALMEAKP